MIKILSSADWHINLHKKKIPYSWAENRFLLLFNKLRELEKQVDIHVISGDIFDKTPDTDETCLVLSYLNSVTIPTIIIPGNHSSTRKGHSFWEHFERDNSITNNNVKLFTKNGRIELYNQGFCMFPYGSVETNNLPEYIENDILVTHIRGDVPPHITAEMDLELIKPWKLILLGDLHFRHKHEPYNMYYPGSPLNTSFDRDNNKKYGIDIVHFNTVDDYTVEFVDLKLPKLIRKTISSTGEMVEDGYNHIVYEVKGSIDELAKVQKTELLDKKIVEKASNNSTLDLKDKSLIEELELYLKHIKISDIDSILAAFKNLGITQ